MIYKMFEWVFKKMEHYLYDDLTHEELEKKCYRLEAIVEELQEKYNDETYYSY